jgi:hypothetical protein
MSPIAISIISHSRWCGYRWLSVHCLSVAWLPWRHAAHAPLWLVSICDTWQISFSRITHVPLQVFTASPSCSRLCRAATGPKRWWGTRTGQAARLRLGNAWPADSSALPHTSFTPLASNLTSVPLWLLTSTPHFARATAYDSARIPRYKRSCAPAPVYQPHRRRAISSLTARLHVVSLLLAQWS